MRSILVKTSVKTYNIIIGRDIVKKFPEFVRSLAPRLPIIITNQRIYSLWEETIDYIKEALGATIIYVPDGEIAKSFDEYIRIINRVSILDNKRKSVFIIAIGGGVIGDLSGFVAGTYRRGVPVVQIPTTLLAQIDASIGGKTAVNLSVGKNLVGVYHQPHLVFIDTNFLSTLDDKQIREGLAEAIKYGVIKDSNLFKYLEESSLVEIDWEYLVHICASIKAKIVSIDEYEKKGIRFILNFGHTIGHALELAGGYRRWSHGEAVSVGMVCATEIALSLGKAKLRTLSRLESVLRKFKLPVKIEKENLDFAKFWSSFNKDKKFTKGENCFILPRCIGKVFIETAVSDRVVKSVVENRSY